jgi:hypothetical protein
MEERERDSDQLGELFKIDHLATRMRRNSENLLVLAGDSGRQEQRTPDTPAEDVLGAAVSEIELYRMVAVGPAPDVAVRGGAVADLAHLVAELLENATTFSALDATVSLDARVRSDGAMVVDIVDEGVGLPGARLAKITPSWPSRRCPTPRSRGTWAVRGRWPRGGTGSRSPAVHGPRPASVLVPGSVLARSRRTCPSRTRRPAGPTGTESSTPGVGAVRASPDGRFVAADGRRGRRTIGWERGRTRTVLPPRSPRDTASTPGGGMRVARSGGRRQDHLARVEVRREHSVLAHEIEVALQPDAVERGGPGAQRDPRRGVRGDLGIGRERPLHDAAVHHVGLRPRDRPPVPSVLGYFSANAAVSATPPIAMPSVAPDPASSALTAPNDSAACVMKGSTMNAAATWPSFSAAAMSGNGTSTNVTASGSTPAVSSAERAVSSTMLPRVLTAIFFPARSCGDRTSEPGFVMISRVFRPAS